MTVEATRKFKVEDKRQPCGGVFPWKNTATLLHGPPTIPLPSSSALSPYFYLFHVAPFAVTTVPVSNIVYKLSRREIN